MRLIKREGDDNEIERARAIVFDVEEAFEEIAGERGVDPRDDHADVALVLLRFVASSVVDEVRSNVVLAEDDGPIRERTWSANDTDSLLELLRDAVERVESLRPKLDKTRDELGFDDFDRAEGEGRR